MKDVLIIAGSAEARALSRLLPQARVRLPVRERVVQPWANPPSTGAVSVDWLRGQGIGMVIEAAHPCDASTAWQVARSCQEAGLPHLQLVRPQWRASRRDRWVPIAQASQAARHIPEGARILVTTGRDTLPELRALRGFVLARRIGAPSQRGFPLQRGRFLCDEGPFSIRHEMSLLRMERIDWMVMRNSGGPGGWPKLAAARALGVRVAMIARPARPTGARVGTIEEALKWLKNTPSG